MARTARRHAEGHWYHVYNRAARRLPIFNDDADRREFLALVGTATSRFEAEVHAYCLLGNHYHLSVHCPESNVDEVMHYIGTVYTQRFNRRYGLDGPLFRGRFGSRPIQGDADFLSVLRYIVRNPVAHGLVGTVGEHRWSSHPAYLSTRPLPNWLVSETGLALCGGRDRYRRLVEGSSQPDVLDEHDKGHEGAHMSLDCIERAVLNLYGTTPADLRRTGPGMRSPARILLFLLAAELTDATSEELAWEYGAASASSVRSAIARGRERLTNDPQFASLHQAAQSHLSS